MRFDLERGPEGMFRKFGLTIGRHYARPFGECPGVARVDFQGPLHGETGFVDILLHTDRARHKQLTADLRKPDPGISERGIHFCDVDEIGLRLAKRVVGATFGDLHGQQVLFECCRARRRDRL